MIDREDIARIRDALKGKTTGRHWKLGIVKSCYWQISSSVPGSKPLVIIDQTPTHGDVFRALETIVRSVKTPMNHEAIADLVKALDTIAYVMRRKIRR